MYNPTSLAFRYIDDVPWDRHPAFADDAEARAYVEAFENVVDLVPEGGAKISFASDRWDFRPYFKDVNEPSYVINFNGLPDELKEKCKFFVLHVIGQKKKIPTACSRSDAFRSIATHIMEDRGHSSISLVTTDDVVDEITARNVGHSRAHSLYQGAYQVFRYLEKHCGLDLLVDIDELDELSSLHKRLSKAEEGGNKLPDIPADYFDAILGAAVSAMRDESAPYNERATGCLVVMLTQLGLRIGDLLILTIDRLRVTTLPRSGKTAHYIHYKSKKPSKPHDKMLEFDIFSSPLCTEAFNTLKSIRARCDLSERTDYLYLLASTTGPKPGLPIPAHRFRKEYARLLDKRLPELCRQEWDGVPMRRLDLDRVSEEVIALPFTEQYRVHLCTALYNHGVPLVYIQKYMGHLSEYMIGYYARPKDTWQEDVEYSERVVGEVVRDDLRLLGGSSGDDLKQRLVEFVEAGEFKVETDVAQIVKALGDKLAIRGKTGGACIRTSLLPCAQDARTNEVLCAYSLCPNLFHFFYMADVSYADFLTLQQTHAAAENAGMLREAEKELNKLKDVVERRLLPELDELERELGRKGPGWITGKYPSLGPVIANLDEIRKEAEGWLEK